MYLYFGLITSLLLTCTDFIIASADLDHHDLISARTKLFRNVIKSSKYEKNVAPLKGKRQPIDVQFGLAMIHLKKSRSGEMTSSSWLRASWIDGRLSWNPAKYGGIKVIRVDPEFLWVPDIALFDPAITPFPSIFLNNPALRKGEKALVYSSGQVMYITTVNIASSCPSVRNQAHTYQCTFTFGSWTYSGYQQNITSFYGVKSIDVSNFKDYRYWSILQNNATRQDVHYPGSDEPYPTLKFNLKVKARNDDKMSNIV